jgi:hypothetical protein
MHQNQRRSLLLHIMQPIQVAQASQGLWTSSHFGTLKFEAQLAGNTSSFLFLIQERSAKAIGFSKTIDAKHTFLMSTHYPAALAGADKIDVLVNAMLEERQYWEWGQGDAHISNDSGGHGSQMVM